jgi:hypothetical protein
MKKITITIDEEVYNELRSAFTVKGITGNLYGTSDAFMYRLLDALEKGKTEESFAFKHKKEERAKK